MVLHVAATSRPGLSAAAERGNVVEIRVLSSELLELVTVVDIGFVPCAEDEPILVTPVAFWLLEEPVQHSPNRRDPGAGRDEHGIFAGLAQGEQPMRAMKLHRCALFQVTEPV